MKNIYLSLFIYILSRGLSFSQFTLITPGTSMPNMNASSSSNGIVIPRMTNSQKLAISDTIQGKMVFDIDSNCISVYSGLKWIYIREPLPSSNNLAISQLNQNQIDSLSFPIGKLAFNTTTKGLFVSDGTIFNSSAIEELDGIEIQTITPTEWANGNKIPVLRLRHPNNVEQLNGSSSITRDYKIIPYSAGMAVEYAGVLEHWVGQFSIHRGINYHDTGDGGNGWGGVLWVGDDADTGGLRMTSRDNKFYNNGNLKWTEISSEKFTQLSAGNLRLRVVDSTDRIDFVRGGRGSNNVYAFLGPNGFQIPSVSNSNSIVTPSKGLIVFDNADSTLKFHTGSAWVTPNKQQSGKDIITISTVLTYTGNRVKFVNATTGNLIITLPPISSESSGHIYKIIRTDNTSNTVTISASNTNKINNVSIKALPTQFDCINFYSNGLNDWVATKESAF